MPGINEEQNKRIEELERLVAALTKEIHELKTQVATLVTKQASIVAFVTIIIQIALDVAK